MAMKQQIKSLIKDLSSGLLEREYEVALSLLCALSGENLFMIGPPGVGKSMLAYRIGKAFEEASCFSYLMSRFSTPDEIFGPVSIAKLKEEDKYCRNVEGYLPTASVVFLDEIWKAGPGILNTLLTAMNERIYRNGTEIVPIRMKLLVAASNELPNTEEGLEALWDRFLVRLCLAPVSDKSFSQLLALKETEVSSCQKPVTERQYQELREKANRVVLPSGVLDGLLRIRIAVEKLNEKEQTACIYISDRRWLQIIRLLKTSAYCNGRAEVCLGDCLLLTCCIWEEQADMDMIRTTIVRALLGNVSESIGVLEEFLENGFKELRERQMECFSQSDYNQLKPYLYNFFYYRVCGKGNFCIFQSDYEALTEQEEAGICYPEPAGGRFNLLRVVRVMEAEKNSAVLLQKMNVRLRKGMNTLFINGVEYPLLMDVPEEARKGVYEFLSSPMDIEIYRNKYEELVATLKEWSQTAGIAGHLFLSEQDKRAVKHELKELSGRLDTCYGNMQKLINPFDERE